jgi:hypothetical protein
VSQDENYDYGKTLEKILVEVSKTKGMYLAFSSTYQRHMYHYICDLFSGFKVNTRRSNADFYIEDLNFAIMIDHTYNSSLFDLTRKNVETRKEMIVNICRRHEGKIAFLAQDDDFDTATHKILKGIFTNKSSLQWSDSKLPKVTLTDERMMMFYEKLIKLFDGISQVDTNRVYEFKGREINVEFLLPDIKLGVMTVDQSILKPFEEKHKDDYEAKRKDVKEFMLKFADYVKEKYGYSLVIQYGDFHPVYVVSQLIRLGSDKPLLKHYPFIGTDL